MSKARSARFGALGLYGDGELPSATSPRKAGSLLHRGIGPIRGGAAADDKDGKKTVTGLAQAEDPPSPNLKDQPKIDGLPAGLQPLARSEPSRCDCSRQKATTISSCGRTVQRRSESPDQSPAAL